MYVKGVYHSDKTTVSYDSTVQFPSALVSVFQLCGLVLEHVFAVLVQSHSLINLIVAVCVNKKNDR